MDALIIGSAQRAEQYELGAYGTICAWAQALEFDGVAESLHETLDEESRRSEALDDRHRRHQRRGERWAEESDESDEDEEDSESETAAAPSSQPASSIRNGSRLAGDKNGE